jgi:hypothetical protein
MSTSPRIKTTNSPYELPKETIIPKRTKIVREELPKENYRKQQNSARSLKARLILFTKTAIYVCLCTYSAVWHEHRLKAQLLFFSDEPSNIVLALVLKHRMGTKILDKLTSMVATRDELEWEPT